MRCVSYTKGFTLIELLTVISIIGLLASIVLVSLSSARVKAKVAASQAQMVQIRTAMESYLIAHDQLPPGAANCSSCSNPCDFASWHVVTVAIQNDGYVGSASSIDRDPWGNAYCYDNNYKQPVCTQTTLVWSMGPDGVSETPAYQTGAVFSGDDVGIKIEDPQC